MPDIRQILDACMYYRHDFGLLSEEEKDHVIYEAQEWFKAWKKAMEDSKPENQNEKKIKEWWDNLH